MTNREAHPDYASYPVGMTVTRRCWDEKTTVTKRGDDDWVSSKGFPMGDKFIFDDEPVEGRLGVIIVHDPRTAGQPFAFAPVGESPKLKALREAAAAIQRAIEMENNGGK